MQTANILGEINLDPLDNVNSFEIETIEKLKFPKITSIDKRLKIQEEITIEYLAVHKSIIEKKNRASVWRIELSKSKQFPKDVAQSGSPFRNLSTR